ncbi:Cytochrome P450 [Gossypium australe]|uniref:Cytochrome P450 n=1 Tax=Gossypium australe TaxID=47621 RepID=A0A5B6X6B4_9ROSI|nr:Cytochrome P450 [Gossypium australe]
MAPQAAGAWPIIGQLRLLGGRHLPHITLGALAEKHGPVYTIWIGVHPGLVVSSWEIAKEIFTNHDVAVTNRPGAFRIQLCHGCGGTLLLILGEMCRIINITLLSNRRFEILKHVRASEVGGGETVPKGNEGKDAIPFLGFLDLGGHEKAMKETAKELDNIAGEWLEEHKRKISWLRAQIDVDTITKSNCYPF